MMRRAWHRWIAAGLRSLMYLLSSLLLVLLLQSDRPAIANMANPEWSGDLLTEPWTDVASLDIQHEDLRLDLRPLTTDGFARIQATYHINNPGEATTLALLFAAPGLETGAVTLDNRQAIAALPTDAPGIPADWGKQEFRQPLQGLWFDVPLSPGTHAIAVDYQGAPSSEDFGILRQYTLEYWLAPARQWNSFGTLTIDVFTSPNWATTLTPDLARVDSGHWQQTFEGLPSDVLTVESHPVLSPVVLGLRWLCQLAGVVIAFFVTFQLYHQLGSRSQSRNWSGGWLVLTCLLLMPLSIPLFWGLGGLGLWAAEALLNPRYLAVSYSYSRMMLVVLGGLLAVPTALLVAIFSFVARRVNRRKRAIAPAIQSS